MSVVQIPLQGRQQVHPGSVGVLASMMPYRKLERLICPFRLPVYLRIMRNCHEQLNLERFPETFPKTGSELGISI